MATEYRSEDSSAGSAELGNSVNPANVDAVVAEPAGKPRKPRSDAGKPRGPRTGTAKKASASPLDLSGLSGVLVGLTAAVAQWRDVPEIEIDPAEANELMHATQNVLRHYSIETTQKGADFIALIGVIAMIGGTRISAYNLRKRMEREDRAQNPNVIHMPGKFPSNIRQPKAEPQSSPVQPMGASTSSVIQPSVTPGPIDEDGGF